MTTPHQEWEDKIISIGDICKKITGKEMAEIILTVRSLLSSHEKTYKAELRAKIEGMKKEEPTAIDLSKYDHPNAVYASWVGYNKAIDNLLKEIT